MAMTTRCPHCGTAFKVVADQLRVRNGLVRCGVCTRVFDGHACLVDGPESRPAAPAASTPAAAPTSSPIASPGSPPAAPPAGPVYGPRPHSASESSSDGSPVLSVRAHEPAPDGYTPAAPQVPAPPHRPPAPYSQATPAPVPMTPAAPYAQATPAAPYAPATPAAPHPSPGPAAPYPAATPRTPSAPYAGVTPPTPSAPGVPTPYHPPAASQRAPRLPGIAPEPAVLRGREDSRRIAADPREPVFSAPYDPDAADEEEPPVDPYGDPSVDAYGDAEPYAPYRQGNVGDAEQQARDMALPREDRFRITARRDLDDDDEEPVFVSVPGEARTRYDDLTDTGMAPPIFMDEDVQRRRTLLARLWVAGCLIGLIVLGLQCIYIYRTSIATAMPALRPALEAACAPLGCHVGYGRRLERISITASSLQPQSAAAQDDGIMRLTLRVTLRNRYDKPQPWPALMLQLTDLSDTVVVRKVLLPENYLPPGTRGPFPAGGEQILSVPLQVEGLHVNGYQLDKFFP